MFSWFVAGLSLCLFVYRSVILPLLVVGLILSWFVGLVCVDHVLVAGFCLISFLVLSSFSLFFSSPASWRFCDELHVN